MSDEQSIIDGTTEPPGVVQIGRGLPPEANGQRGQRCQGQAGPRREPLLWPPCCLLRSSWSFLALALACWWDVFLDSRICSAFAGSVAPDPQPPPRPASASAERSPSV